MAGKGLLKSVQRLGRAPRINVRAQRFEPYVRPDRAEPVALVPGLNEPESRVYYALRELRVNFSTQSSFGGGSYLGGARADFLLPDHRLVLNYHGPFHFTSAGKARDLLVDETYRAAGYRVDFLTDDDLPNLKAAILRKIGLPLGG